MHKVFLILIVAFAFAGCASRVVNPTVKVTDDLPQKTDTHYVINNDTVYDKETNLIWQRCSVGQRWIEKKGCIGNIRTMTSDSAQKQGTAVWRIPTKEELATLLDAKLQKLGQKPAIDIVAFPNMNPAKTWYWSSSPALHSGYFGVSFDGANKLDTDTTQRSRAKYGAVRLVRTGK